MLPGYTRCVYVIFDHPFRPHRPYPSRYFFVGGNILLLPGSFFIRESIREGTFKPAHYPLLLEKGKRGEVIVKDGTTRSQFKLGNGLK